MPAIIDDFDLLITDAIKKFWSSRTEAACNQKNRGYSDQGNRANVTAGKNLDGFVAMTKKLIIKNGISNLEVHTDGRKYLTIPGFYRPCKNWDLLVISNNQLLAAIEFKSQVGPSFGNNFNNRVEEALGNATDLIAAFREGVFGDSPKPFIGYFFVLEECQGCITPVNFKCSHFSLLPDFQKASYANGYEIFCRKLVQEGLYDAAALILTPQSAINTGEFRSVSEFTGARRFAATLAGKIAGMAAEKK
jgi:hypothetical protein